jgi:hypothetical protein
MNPNSIVAIGNVYFVHVDGAVGRICTNDGLDIALEGSLNCMASYGATRKVSEFILKNQCLAISQGWPPGCRTMPMGLQVAVNQLTTRHCVYRTLSHLPT